MSVILLNELNINQALNALFLVLKMEKKQYNMISLSIDTRTDGHGHLSSTNNKKKGDTKVSSA